MKQILILTSLCVLLLVAALGFMSAHQPEHVYRVYVDDEEIGLVASLDEYTQVLRTILAAEQRQAGLGLDFSQNIVAEREFHWNSDPDAEEVKAMLQANTTFITVGWAVEVEDECLFWTATREEAENVLDQVKQRYVEHSDSRELLAAEITEDVKIYSQQVQPEDVIDVESAVAILTQGQQEVETYTVAAGDSLWSISRSMNVAEPELRAANPSLDDNGTLQPGQDLNLVSVSSKVNVETLETECVNESIPFSTTYQSSGDLWYNQSRIITPGKPGQRETTYEVRCVNGIEEERQVIESQVNSEPKTQVVQRGTARWPSRATGMFRWPLNTGRISDCFGGARNHRGVDIAAPGGTGIFAAASGTVSTSTWGGSYGNYVVIDHGNGYSTLYAHNSANLVGVGQRVGKGELIARVGTTGNSTGNHLHFEVQRYGSPINPLQFFAP